MATSTPRSQTYPATPRTAARTADARFDALYRLAIAAEGGGDGVDGHPGRVGRFGLAIAQQMALSSCEAAGLAQAAALHDVGKLTIPETILRKPDRLTAAEFEIVKSHTRAGAAMLSGGVGSRLLSLAGEIALTHHERVDGRGYPDGLIGTEIPLSGRIVALADVFDALTHVRPYKQAWSVERALQMIRAKRGTHFDPDVVDAFLAVVGELPLAGSRAISSTVATSGVASSGLAEAA